MILNKKGAVWSVYFILAFALLVVLFSSGSLTGYHSVECEDCGSQADVHELNGFESSLKSSQMQRALADKTDLLLKGQN